MWLLPVLIHKDLSLTCTLAIDSQSAMLYFYSLPNPRFYMAKLLKIDITMCHLCRTLEQIQSLDSSITKPIRLLLAVLHKHVEPHMGDLWLWRHDRTAQLQKLLNNAHQKAPSDDLRKMVRQVEKELAHIKCNMPEHPPRPSTGRWGKLNTEIYPCDSISNDRFKASQHAQNKISKVEPREATLAHLIDQKPIQRQMGTGGRDLYIEETRPTLRALYKKNNIESLPELSGSDVDPPSVSSCPQVVHQTA
jgi:hypothetical protein